MIRIFNNLDALSRAAAGIRIVPVPNGQMPPMARNSVDLPEPESPVNQMTSGFCLLAAARADFSTIRSSKWMFVARRSAKAMIPTPTVSPVSRSARRNAPVARLSATASKAMASDAARLHWAISYFWSVRAGSWTLPPVSRRYLIEVTLAAVDFPAIFSVYVRPGRRLSAPVQTRRAANWSQCSGRRRALARTSPGTAETADENDSVTLMPASALSVSPSPVEMPVTRAT